MEPARARSSWLKEVALEGAIVTLLLAVIGFFYLRPASTELLRGNASVMIGEGGDNVTVPWQYRMVVDLLHSRPWDLVFGAVYSDQMGAPEGNAHFIPMIERIVIVFLSPFMRTDLMPTAVVWVLMVLSGLCFHAFGRVLGWPRAVAFALSVAWAFCPFTRARAVVHNVMCGTYWAPLLFLALFLLARPPKRLSTRAATVVAALMMLVAVFAAHYFVVVAAIMTPAFLLYYVLLVPRGASRARALARLAVAAFPAAFFVVWSTLVPSPSYGARAMAPVVTARSETASYLGNYGAHPMDYVLGDMKFGDRDLLPLRSKLTREARVEVPYNRHERSNGIRWSVLAAFAALGVALSVGRLRRRLSPIERALGVFAFVLGAFAFFFAMSPQGLRMYDVDLGPVQLVAKVFPRFRVPNRLGVMVHFAALLGAGVLLARVLRRPLESRGGPSIALHAGLPLLMLLDYAPIYPVTVAPVARRRIELDGMGGAGGAACGAGLPVPYVTWAFDDNDYYNFIAEVRGTSCKILHGGYLTREDETLRKALGKTVYTDADRVRAEQLARCTGASWVVFRLSTPTELRRAFCADMGWSFVSEDACRAAPVPASALPRIRSVRECADGQQ